MKKIVLFTAVLAAVAMMPLSVSAATLASWDMTGLAASQASAPVTTVGADMSSSALTSGPRFSNGIAWVDAMGTFSEQWRMGSDIWNSVALGSYYSFTLTPDAGNTVSYDSIDVRFAVNAGATTTDATFHLLSSQTGFTGADALDTVNIVNNDTGNYVPTIYSSSFDLSGAGLTGISTPTEFRIYASVAVGGNRSAIGHTWSGVNDPDDLIVSGTVSVVPEPSTIGLLALSGLALVLRRRS